MTYKEILIKRNDLQKRVELLQRGCFRIVDKYDKYSYKNSIEQLKREYMFYNGLLKNYGKIKGGK